MTIRTRIRLMRRQPAAPSRPHTIKRYWIRALVRGQVLNTDMQRKWLASPAPESPAKPDGQKYGYGITKISFGPNSIYFHGGELPAREHGGNVAVPSTRFTKRNTARTYR